MKKLLVLSAVLTITIFSCGKKDCANARICVVNDTSDTVYYSWNSNWYSDTLAPGERACDEVGELDRYSSYTTTFNSSKGTYGLDISSCEEIYYIDGL